MTYPACFADNRDWVNFVETSTFLQRKTRTGEQPVVDFCEECTEKFQRRMMDSGRCLRNASRTEDEFEAAVIPMVAAARTVRGGRA